MGKLSKFDLDPEREKKIINLFWDAITLLEKRE